MLDWPDPSEIDGLTDHQRDALRAAFRTPFALLEGPPGSGKTFVAGKVIAHILRKHPMACVAGGAPTGKAAVRLQENLETFGVSCWTGTQHRMLGVQRNGHGDGDWNFQYCRDRPLPVDVLLLDEQSMADTPLTASTTDAIKSGTRVLMVGDAHQLPPVGHGRPFADLLNLNKLLGVGKLTEIHRNAGEIVHVCKQIRDGVGYNPPAFIDRDLGLNIKHIEARGGVAVQKVKDIIDAVRGEFDPIGGVQVIVARNESGDVNRERLNGELQEFLNPDGERVDGCRFRVGDKVICTKNGWYRDVEAAAGKGAVGESGGSATAYVSNGDTGVVKHVAQKTCVVQWQAPPRLTEMPTKDGPLDLAYAVTCHKMQGSQAHVAIVLADEKDRNVCSRQWWYTAISRAQDLCFVVGSKSAVQAQVRRQTTETRKTFLYRRLRTFELEVDPAAKHLLAIREPKRTYSGIYTGD